MVTQISPVLFEDVNLSYEFPEGTLIRLDEDRIIVSSLKINSECPVKVFPASGPVSDLPMVSLTVTAANTGGTVCLPGKGGQFTLSYTKEFDGETLTLQGQPMKFMDERLAKNYPFNTLTEENGDLFEPLNPKVFVADPEWINVTTMIIFE